jgi:hypothetical protein
MSLEHMASLAKPLKLLLGEITLLCESRIKYRGRMSLGKDKAVSIHPTWVLRVYTHFAKK